MIICGITKTLSALQEVILPDSTLYDDVLFEWNYNGEIEGVGLTTMATDAVFN
ncbi:predicted protein [Plenodomus lingam JN3]|uniref:Uncharacterized protein n=1 Tax=Leptosphaeria maculans (strain JN3 / isolate v23.1.3 / race Av1-4-5-6-7-8) TaxID=985895 RepID=E4ZG19_LEPMJ|nr:predicted protein [Plenodomus lingam JN3]CBX90239.1 predicted protein [Plenodomus lingam JN3]